MKHILFWTILTISFLLLVTAAFRGIIYHDEGYIVYAASRLLDGQVMYRDFHFAYTPGSVFLTAFVFGLWGQSIFVERIIVVILAVITMRVIYFLSKQITARSQKLAARSNLHLLLPLLIFLSWGPMHTNFVWPVMTAILTGLATCYWYLKGLRDKKIMPFLLAGILTVLTFLCKQNFGIGLLGLLLVSLLIQRNLRFLSCYFLGILLSSAVFFVYLLQTQSLIPFWDDFQTYTIQRIILDQSLNTPFFYGTTLVAKIAKALLYLFPAYTSLAALWIAYKQKSSQILLPGFCLIFYILGIRPTTDYNHLAPLLALSGLPLLLVRTQTHKTWKKNAVLMIALALIATGFFSAFFKGYYQWQMPLYQNTVFVSDPRVRIWLNPKDAAIVTQVIKTSKTYTKQSKYIFVNTYAPMLYFITGKQNPTAFDLLSFTPYYYRSQKDMINQLTARNVSLIITASDLKTDTTPLGTYIKTRYTLKPAIQDFYYFYR